MARQHRRLTGATVAVALAAALGIAALFLLPNSACRRVTVPPNLPEKREMPSRFPKDTHLPPIKESLASGPIDLATFNPTQDLVRFECRSVWFESDEDKVREEDDHVMHRLAAAPLRRLVALVEDNGGRLKVHEAYRCTGIHKSRSLHREGRALDLTCEKMSLSDLAKFCWVAGFDWVYYEAPSGGGEHVHCSVRR
jgi:hypothetical protein